MKKLAILLIAGALVSPAFAEPRSADNMKSGTQAQTYSAAQAAPSVQPAE